MKKISISIVTLLATFFLNGCGSDSGSSSKSSSTIGAGETKTLATGTTISTYSGTCTTNIVVEANGDWTVTNTSSNPADICQYN